MWLSRLYVISDVLQNAGSISQKNAWCFRKEFESQLPEFFLALERLAEEGFGAKGDVTGAGPSALREAEKRRGSHDDSDDEDYDLKVNEDDPYAAADGDASPDGDDDPAEFNS